MYNNTTQTHMLAHYTLRKFQLYFDPQGTLIQLGHALTPDTKTFLSSQFPGTDELFGRLTGYYSLHDPLPYTKASEKRFIIDDGVFVIQIGSEQFSFDIKEDVYNEIEEILIYFRYLKTY